MLHDMRCLARVSRVYSNTIYVPYVHVLLFKFVYLNYVEGIVHEGSISIYFRFSDFYTIRRIDS